MSQLFVESTSFVVRTKATQVKEEIVGTATDGEHDFLAVSEALTGTWEPMNVPEIELAYNMFDAELDETSDSETVTSCEMEPTQEDEILKFAYWVNDQIDMAIVVQWIHLIGVAIGAFNLIMQLIFRLAVVKRKVSLNVIEKPGKGGRPVLMMAKGQCRLKRGLTMDSGAHHSVMPKRLVRKERIRPSAWSRLGLTYVAANKGEIKNEGEVDYHFTSRENRKMSWPFQIADVNKALVAVADRVDEGYRVIYDKDMDSGEDLTHMILKKTGEIMKLSRDGNVWVMEAVIDPEDAPESFGRLG